MKTDMPGKKISRQVILGVLVIGMGLLFLLDNMGIWNFGRALRFWPMAFIVIGVIKLFDTNSPDGVILGSALILVGVLMMLDRLGLVYFSWRAIWPVMLIALGASVVYRAVAGRRLAGAALKDALAADDVVDVTAILGGVERRIDTAHFKGGEITAVMGGCALDLRGGITLKCPPDWSVVLHGTPIMGGVEVRN